MPGARGSGGHGRVGPPKKGAERRLADALTETAAPVGLSAAATAYWRYYAPILLQRKLWTASSRDVLRNYCEALVLRDRLQQELEVAPLVCVETSKAHPLLAQIRAVRLECRQHANDLCLPPAAAVRTPLPDDDQADDVLPHDFYGDKRPKTKGARLN